MDTATDASDDSTVLPTPLKKETVESDHVEVGENVEEVLESGEKKKQSTVSTEWMNGVVALWKRSHGFIRFEEEDKESKRIFFHKSNVSTEDKKVHLRRGTEVRFHIESLDDGKTNAVDVQARDGGPLNFHMKHGEEDTLYDRVSMFNDEIFCGEVKFFSRLRGYGRINLSKEGAERVKELQGAEGEEKVDDLYFKEIDMNVENFPAKIGRNDKVQFQIFKSSRGYGAVHVCLEGGAPIPEFVRPEKPEKPQEEKVEKKPEKKEKRQQRRDRKRRTGKREEKKTENRDRREKRKSNFRKKKDFLEIDPETRFDGIVCAFSPHRFGFIKMFSQEESAEMAKFGILKSGKLGFRVQDIDTEQRPAMINAQTKVKFSINRVESGVLYAINIRGEDEKPIVCTRTMNKSEPRKLLAEEWIEGTVKFFNWRRGHGRITIEGSEDEFYFHRNDLQSNDKVAGIEAGTKVLCQKVDDPKGPAVTNICNPDKTKLENHLPRYMKSDSKREEKAEEEVVEEAEEAQE